MKTALLLLKKFKALPRPGKALVLLLLTIATIWLIDCLAV